jgi:hypothetical protein
MRYLYHHYGIFIIAETVEQYTFMAGKVEAGYVVERRSIDDGFKLVDFHVKESDNALDDVQFFVIVNSGYLPSFYDKDGNHIIPSEIELKPLAEAVS